MNGRLFALLAALALAGCDSVAADAPSRDAGQSGGDDDGPGGRKDGGAKDPDGGTPGTEDLDGTVKSYTYAFDLTTTRATAKLAVNGPAPGRDCLTIDCRTNEATDVTWNGAPATSSTLGSGALAVCGPASGAAGTTDLAATIPEIPTQTLFGLDVGFSRKPDLAGGSFTYLLSWVGGCDRFGPCDADPSRLSEFHFEITHPEGTVVLCPGKLTAGTTTTKCDIAGTLAPTYSAFGLAADPKWTRTAYTSAAGVDVFLYEVPGGTIGAHTDHGSYGEFLGWITTLLGPYPYGSELRFAGAPTVWLGFEHPANIILNEGLGEMSTDFANSAQHVMMHETIHQWSGDRTTIASTSDFVWKEAIAEYLAYVFEDEHRPAGEAALSLQYWDSIAVTAKHRPRPTDSPEVQDFYGDVYGAGPLVLFAQLEPLIGRQAVLNGIKSFLAAPGAKSVDELKNELGRAASKDLTNYFDAWVVGPGEPEWPKFDVTTSQANGQLTVNVTQDNPSGVLYGCKVEIDVAGKRATADFGLAPTTKTVSTTIPFTGTPSPITVDPDHKLVNRTGTEGFAPPRRKKVWIF